jgi:hypothetical protein
MTLEDYRRFAVFNYGKNSKAVEFLDRKIKESPMGEDEQVLAEPHQMLILLRNLNDPSRMK